MNKKMVMQGHSNYLLDETGIAQAVEVGKKLKEKGIRFDRVYASPLTRAIQTALLVSGFSEEKMKEIILSASPSGSGSQKLKAEALQKYVIVDERLIEMDYGPYEGTSLKNLPPEILTFFRDFQNTPAPEGMEPLDSVVKRSGEFLEEIRETAKEESILIATHAIAMKGLLEYLTPESKGSFWSSPIKNCEIYTSFPDEGGYSLPQCFPLTAEGFPENK